MPSPLLNLFQLHNKHKNNDQETEPLLQPSSSDSSSQATSLHAVKFFRRTQRRDRDETQRHQLDHILHLLCESQHHPNVIRTTECLFFKPSCPDGDLHSYILTTASGCIQALEADCFFKQILRGVHFLHANHIAHGNLTTENILLTGTGAVKISGFGSAELMVHRKGQLDGSIIIPIYPSSSSSSSSSSSTKKALWKKNNNNKKKKIPPMPYLPPEELNLPFETSTNHFRGYDRRASDIWAVGILYLAMRTGHLPWRIAKEEDDGGYAAYLRGRRGVDGYWAIEGLGRRQCRNVIYAMLCPDARRRLTADQVLRAEWVYRVVVCEAGEKGR